MAGGFKKYSVDHEALFNDVRSNRYAKDKASEPARAESKPVEDQPKPNEPPPVTPAAEATPRQDTAPPAKKVDTPAPSAGASSGAPAKTAAKGPAKETDTVQVRVRVRFPASGVSPKYDALAAQLGEDEAFRAVFRAAFENYRKRLDEGKMPEGPKSYSMSKETHRSNKVMTARQFKVVTDALDPEGLTAPATLGRIISERALALFFDEEAKAKTA